MLAVFALLIKFLFILVGKQLGVQNSPKLCFLVVVKLQKYDRYQEDF